MNYTTSATFSPELVILEIVVLYLYDTIAHLLFQSSLTILERRIDRTTGECGVNCSTSAVVGKIRAQVRQLLVESMDNFSVRTERNYPARRSSRRNFIG